MPCADYVGEMPVSHCPFYHYLCSGPFWPLDLPGNAFPQIRVKLISPVSFKSLHKCRHLDETKPCPWHPTACPKLQQSLPPMTRCNQCLGSIVCFLLTKTKGIVESRYSEQFTTKPLYCWCSEGFVVLDNVTKNCNVIWAVCGYMPSVFIFHCCSKIPVTR